MKAVFCTKPFKQIIPVLINSSHKIICHSNIKSSVFLIGDNINIHPFHKENIFHLNIAVNFHLFLPGRFLLCFIYVLFPVIIRLPQSLSACLSHYPPVPPHRHYPAFFFSVIIRLDRIIHTAEHHFPSSAASPVLTRRVRLDRSIRRNGDGSKEIARSSRAMTLKESNRAMITKESNRETKTKESSRETRKQTGQRQKRRDSLIKTKTPFCSDIPVKPECD